jgi:hypothetical protein
MEHVAINALRTEWFTAPAPGVESARITPPASGSLRLRSLRHATRLAAGIFILTILILGCPRPPLARAADPSTATNVGVASGSTGQQTRGPYFAPGAVTFSTEVYELGQDDLTAAHTSLVNYFRQLGPGVLRIGGDTADESWWTSSSEPAPSWAVVTVTPADLSRLESFLAATGWRVALTVDLGHYDPARAANEVTYASQILGSNLAGIEIGNEPNDFSQGAIGLRASSYDVSPYAEEFQAYANAIEDAVPGTKILGPDTSATTWFNFLAAKNSLPVAALTEHYYPTSYSVASGACAATPVPTAEQLLSPDVWSTESSLATDLVSEARADNLPAQIDETNDTSSCDEAGGPDTSPVFASAIWALDWSLRASSAGIASIAFHDEFGTCGPYAFSPVCAPDSTAEAMGQVAARPEYLGLLAASDLEGGRFVPVAITSNGSTSGESAYATVAANGKIVLAVINASFTSSLEAQVDLPENGDVTTSLLDAPSPDATDGATFGAIASGTDEDTTALTLPPVSAAIITLQPTGQTATTAAQPTTTSQSGSSQTPTTQPVKTIHSATATQVHTSARPASKKRRASTKRVGSTLKSAKKRSASSRAHQTRRARSRRASRRLRRQGRVHVVLTAVSHPR